MSVPAVYPARFPRLHTAPRPQPRARVLPTEECSCSYCGGPLQGDALVVLADADYSVSGFDVSGAYCSVYCLSRGVEG